MSTRADMGRKVCEKHWILSAVILDKARQAKIQDP
jgi:hypothetical protein